ncbi:MAG: phosphatidylglycerol lysyltransferase domain-containing protein, partial [Pseudomonadota bacterium]
ALGVLAVSAVLISQRLDDTDPSEIWRLVQSIPAANWYVALILTAMSFAAIGLYDVAVHRWLNTGVTGRRAATTGAAAIAVSQTVGFGLVTGTIARWQLLPELRLERAAQVTAVVAGSFACSLVVSIGLAGLVFGLPEAVPRSIVPLGIGLGLAVFVASIAQPRRLPFRPPSVRILGGVLGATLADTVLAALALWVLLPDPSLLTPTAIIAAFMVATGAGLLSGTPSGVGAFELTLLWLLPEIPEADLIAAALAFRLVYYAVPAILGGLTLFAAVLCAPKPRETETLPDAPGRDHIRAEAKLVRQGEFSWRRAGPGHVAASETGQTLVALGDPAVSSSDVLPTLAAFGKSARAIGLSPALYKCSARTAATARQIGWRALHVADELWLDPATYRTDGPQRARLRRKLRAAQRAGCHVTHGTRPRAEMEAVASDWLERHGGERGFSMGRWDWHYAASQIVFLAWQGDRLVAFATFHHTSMEWTLDLMRASRDAPDGTMHALIDLALKTAAMNGCARLSLAALPSDVVSRFCKRIGWKDSSGDGLRQFKSSFAPCREPRYIAAPSWLSLALAALDIRRRIMRPVALQETIRPQTEAQSEYAAASISS